MTSLSQALRNAIEVERGAARFYERLAQQAKEPEAKQFLEQMTREEIGHAAALEHKSRELGVELPAQADWRYDSVETVPDWTLADDITLEQALAVALEAEQHAELFYDAIAETAGSGPAADFLRGVARAEAQHVQALSTRIARIKR
jgi:rubrerythrin